MGKNLDQRTIIRTLMVTILRFINGVIRYYDKASHIRLTYIRSSFTSRGNGYGI